MNQDEWEHSGNLKTNREGMKLELFEDFPQLQANTNKFVLDVLNCVIEPMSGPFSPSL